MQEQKIEEIRDAVTAELGWCPQIRITPGPTMVSVWAKVDDDGETVIGIGGEHIDRPTRVLAQLATWELRNAYLDVPPC